MRSGCGRGAVGVVEVRLARGEGWAGEVWLARGDDWAGGARLARGEGWAAAGDGVNGRGADGVPFGGLFGAGRGVLDPPPASGKM